MRRRAYPITGNNPPVIKNLSELCRRFAPSVRRQMGLATHIDLAHLKKGYTPFVANTGGGIILDMAFMRIGKDAIDVEPALSRSDSEVVRCRAFDFLNFIANKNTGSVTDRQVALSCIADLRTPDRGLSGWGNWWQKHRDALKVPVLPDILCSVC